MGTNQSNCNKFRNLFKKFEEEIEKSKKLEKNTIYGFAKYYISNNSDSDECKTKGNPVGNLRRKLQRWQEGINTNRNFQNHTLEELKKYYKSLNKEYFFQELLDDEHPKYWFD